MKNAISNIQSLIRDKKEITDRYSSRYLAIKLLEKDSTTLKQMAPYANIEKIKTQCEIEIRKLEKEYKEKSDTIITDAKYGFISGALNETFMNSGEKSKKSGWLSMIS